VTQLGTPVHDFTLVDYGIRVANFHSYNGGYHTGGPNAVFHLRHSEHVYSSDPAGREICIDLYNAEVL
jgi:hypothetical protein